MNTTMPEFQLTHPEPPAPLPRDIRLTNIEDLVGHTITAVIDAPRGARVSIDALIVTETGCWMTLEARPDDDEHAHLVTSTGRSYLKDELQDALVNFASPDELQAAGLISAAQAAALTEQLEAERQKERARRVLALRAQADRIEMGPA